MFDLKIKKLSPLAKMPAYGTEFSAGADLYAATDVPITIKSGETVLVKTGLSMEIPEGYAGFIYARSGLSIKEGLAPANKVGVIDSDYRGEIMVSLHNHSKYDRQVEPEERIAQIVIAPFLKVNYVLSDDLSDTERGEGGFGSTGKF